MKKKFHLNSHYDRVFEKDCLFFSNQFFAQREFNLEGAKKFYRNQEKRLKRWHRCGGGGREITKRRADLLDVLFRNIFSFLKQQQQGSLQRFCVVALGGYGRSEMNPYSDVDLLFLHEEKKLRKKEEEIIISFLMGCWDFGLKVGHATRSFEEAFFHANNDFVSKTAMLESRLIIGDGASFQRFKRKFRKKCILGQEKKYLCWRLESIQQMREKFGKTVFMQEPHIKSGNGGLRDYQNLLWIALVYYQTSSLDFLIKKKLLSEQEKIKLEKNYDFLLRVRTEMHDQEKRAVDKLTLCLQGKIAQRLGHAQRSILRRTESLMKSYYRATRETSLIASALLARLHFLSQKEKKFFGFQPFLKLQKKKVKKVDDFLLQDGFLFLQEDKKFVTPFWMMKVFHLAATKNVQFSSELVDFLKEQLYQVNRSFRNSKEAQQLFLSILSQKGNVGKTLRVMHELGFLGKYLPEFGALTCLVQHEFYHLYTADEHTLLAIEKIDELLFTNNKKLLRYSNLLKNLEHSSLLYLAMLLHDSGRAANTPHHVEESIKNTKKVALRWELSPEAQELLVTLVGLHAQLATVARTRDLEDPLTIEKFAHQVKKISTLNALTILTLADGMGVNDHQWSDWKEQLIWNLYDRTKKYLEAIENHGILSPQEQSHQSMRQEVIKKMFPPEWKEEIKVHFEQMPARYFRMKEVASLAEHIQLFHTFFIHQEMASSQGKNPLEAEILWKEYPELGYCEVAICGWDRQRLLERIADSFLRAGINILSADIFTRSDCLTLDIFRVRGQKVDSILREKQKKTMEKQLQELLKINGNEIEDRFHQRRIKKEESIKQKNDSRIETNVRVDNHSHPIYTLVEVETADREGLFYDLLGALNYGDLCIDCARIATEMDVAFDTFYILGSDKKKIMDQELLDNLQERIEVVTKGY